MPVALPSPHRDGAMAVERALALRRSVREFSERELPLAAAAQLLWAAQGTSDARGLRTAPSAGALHPRERIAAAALDQVWVAEAPAILVLGAVVERSARRYGGRAPRYVHMEVGHAAQNVYLQAVSLGLGTCMVGAFDDAGVRTVLGRTPELDVLALLPVGTPR